MKWLCLMDYAIKLDWRLLYLHDQAWGSISVTLFKLTGKQNWQDREAQD